MRKKLALIGVAGLGMGALFLGAATMMGGNVLAKSFLGLEDFHLDNCPADEILTARSRNIDWDGGDAVVIKLPADIRYRAGSGTQLVVTGDPRLVAHVAVVNGVLAFTCNLRHRLRNAEKLDVTLPGREFRSFELMGAGDLTLAGIDQPELELTLKGAGNVHAEGKTACLDVDVRGLGDLDLGALIATNATLSIRGAGDMDVAAEERLKVDIRGAGDVHLKREPKELITDIRGAGSVYHADGSKVGAAATATTASPRSRKYRDNSR